MKRAANTTTNRVTATDRGPPLSLSDVAYRLVIAALVVTALYTGRDFLIPIALTTLISFVLAPVVKVLRRHIGLVAAATVAVALTTAVVVGIALLLTWQIIDLAGNIDQYKGNLRHKIEALRGPDDGGGLIDRVGRVLRELSEDLARPRASAPAEPATGAPPRPQVVEIAQGPVSAFAQVTSFLGPLLWPILTTGLVIVLVGFMLLEREQLTDRLVRLISRGDISRTTEAINDAASRVSRYLRMQLFINVGFAGYVAGGLWLLGMPNPLLWGLLGGVLRLIPYAGPMIAAIVPATVALAASPDWTLPLLVLALVMIGEALAGQVVEPLLYGASTGISSLAILISAIFWGVVWGPIGLVLATPLTVCLSVIGRYVPHMEFLGVLLADAPALPIDTKIYHRLLARAPLDAVEIAVDHAREHGVIDLFDNVLAATLMLAEVDRRRDALDVERQKLVSTGISEIIDSLADLPDTPPKSAEAADDNTTEAPQQSLQVAQDDIDRRLAATESSVEAAVLCVGARSELDRASALMVAEVLRRRHVVAVVRALVDFGQPKQADRMPSVAVLCFASNVSPTVIDHVSRRITVFCETVPRIVVLIDGDPSGAPLESTADGPQFADTISEAAQLAVNLLRQSLPKAA